LATGNFRCEATTPLFSQIRSEHGAGIPWYLVPKLKWQALANF
jgi:hypothetical protein